MKKSNNLDKLEKLVEPEMDQLKQNMIFQSDGRYHVFGQYTITKQSDNTYLACKQNRDPEFFSALRFALSWCIADKYKKLDLAASIKYLDQQRVGMLNNVKIRQHLAKKIQDPARKEIAELKVANKKHGLVYVENQLTKCVNLAKYWQIKGFNCDETARTRHSQTTR
jgi:hypothetical protein